MSTEFAYPAAVAGCAGTADTHPLTVALHALSELVQAVVDVYAAHGIPLPDLGGDRDA